MLLYTQSGAAKPPTFLGGGGGGNTQARGGRAVRLMRSCAVEASHRRRRLSQHVSAWRCMHDVVHLLRWNGVGGSKHRGTASASTHPSSPP